MAESTMTIEIPGQEGVTIKASDLPGITAKLNGLSDELRADLKERVSGIVVGHGGVLLAAERLRTLIERIERLEEEKTALAADIREVFAEAKGAGFDTKVMRQVIKLRKMETADRQEQEHLLDLYKRALGLDE